MWCGTVMGCGTLQRTSALTGGMLGACSPITDEKCPCSLVPSTNSSSDTSLCQTHQAASSARLTQTAMHADLQRSAEDVLRTGSCSAGIMAGASRVGRRGAAAATRRQSGPRRRPLCSTAAALACRHTHRRSLFACLVEQCTASGASTTGTFMCDKHRPVGT